MATGIKSEEFKRFEQHVYEALLKEGATEEDAELRAEIITERHFDQCETEGRNPMEGVILEVRDDLEHQIHYTNH